MRHGLSMRKPKHVAMILGYHNPRLSILAANSVLAAGDADVILVEPDARKEDMKEIRKAFTSRWGWNPRVILLPLKENRFTAWGMNQGIKEALRRGYEYITIMCDDVTLDAGYFKVIESDGFEIIQPKIYFGFTDTIYAAGTGMKAGLPILCAHGEPDHSPHVDCPRQLEFASAVTMTMKRKVFKNIGLIDEAYEMYYDDVDLTYRAHRAGYHILYNPKAVSRHHTLQAVGQSHGKTMARTIKYSERNRLLFAYKNGLFNWRFLLMDTLHAIKFSLFNPRMATAVINGKLWFWNDIWFHEVLEEFNLTDEERYKRARWEQ